MSIHKAGTDTVLIERALGVIVHDAKIRAWLQENDPKAFDQCIIALHLEAPWILDGKARPGERPVSG